MTTNTVTDVETFREQIETKLTRTVNEFAQGKLSRELFQMIYERYSGQLSMIDKALATGNLDSVLLSGSGEATIAMRDAYEGKARGVMVYHNRTGTVLDTLGTVDVPLSVLAPILNRFSMLMEEDQMIKPQAKHVSDCQWVLFIAGEHTTIVTEFKNQPSPAQTRTMQRLHHDFEKANAGSFGRDLIDASKLALPFHVFIERVRR